MPTAADLKTWRRRLIRYEYLAEVIEVVDGDTVDCRIDLGFDPEQTTKRFRLLGIDAPEPHTETRAAGDAATDHLNHLIRRHKLGTLDGHPVLFVRSHKNKHDGWIRYRVEHSYGGTTRLCWDHRGLAWPAIAAGECAEPERLRVEGPGTEGRQRQVNL